MPLGKAVFLFAECIRAKPFLVQIENAVYYRSLRRHSVHRSWKNEIHDLHAVAIGPMVPVSESVELTAHEREKIVIDRIGLVPVKSLARIVIYDVGCKS